MIRSDSMTKKNRKITYWMISLLSICGVIAIWYLCIDILELKSNDVFPGPVKVLETKSGAKRS